MALHALGPLGRRCARAADDPRAEEELYSHEGDDSTDMDRWENVNEARDHPALAARSALRAQVVAFFSANHHVDPR